MTDLSNFSRIWKDGSGIFCRVVLLMGKNSPLFLGTSVTCILKREVWVSHPSTFLIRLQNLSNVGIISMRITIRLFFLEKDS